MNKILSFLILFFILVIPTFNIKASATNQKFMTVEQAFKIIRNNSKDDILVYALAKGVIAYAVIVSTLNKNEKQLQCVNRPPTIWTEFVFDEYKKDNRKGSDDFELALSVLVYKMCFNK